MSAAFVAIRYFRSPANHFLDRGGPLLVRQVLLAKQVGRVAFEAGSLGDRLA